jgi:hypothetical protein
MIYIKSILARLLKNLYVKACIPLDVLTLNHIVIKMILLSFVHLFYKSTIEFVEPHVGLTYLMVNLFISCTEMDKRLTKNAN